MLLGRLRIRGKLAVLVVIPLLAVAALTVPVVLERVERAGSAADMAEAVRVAGRIGEFIQDVQLERMASIGFLVGTVDRTQLDRQVARVDSHAARLAAEATGADPGRRLPGRVASAVAGLDRLAPLRVGVFDRSANRGKLIAGYGQVVTRLLDSLALERSVDVRTPVGRQVMALDASLRADELIATSAAYLIVAAASRDKQDLVPYSTTLVMLDSGVGRLTAFATPAQIRLYIEAQTALRKQLGTQFTTSVNDDLFELITTVPLGVIYTGLGRVVGPGRVVSDRIIADVTDDVTEQRSRELTAAYLVGGLSLLVLLLVIGLSYAIGRSVVGSLTRLTRSAERVAGITEEELTRVADDETEVPDGHRLDPIGEIDAPGEIGDLARAFARVQGTAADLVERQVVSRRNVAQMFGHVGRRTQNLVSRQIAIIDRLEAKETDPGRLQQLYRLDHVSSRLRRNAGNLVVLSGGTSTNEHLNPLPLGDVTRLALAEIEDYTRVDVLVPAELTLVPAAIGDMVLMLAELMENATVFSPPHSRVTVNAVATANGARLAVVDHGIGLSEDLLNRENSRLQRRERLDLAPTGVLGLFVVGRLARRHGLKVLLGTTPGGGVTATVDIPAALLASSRPPAGPEAGTNDETCVLSLAEIADARNEPAAPAGDVPAASQPAGVVDVRSEPPATVGASAFNQTAVSRASRSIATGTSWSAFVPQQNDDPGGAPPASPSLSGTTMPTPPASPSLSGTTLPTPPASPSLSGTTMPTPPASPSLSGTTMSTPTDGAGPPRTALAALDGGMPPPDGGIPGTPARMGDPVPAASLADQPTAIIPVVTEDTARSLVEDLGAGIRRAQSETQVLPVIDPHAGAAPAVAVPVTAAPAVAVPVTAAPAPAVPVSAVPAPAAPAVAVPVTAVPPAESSAPPAPVRPLPVAPAPLVSPEALAPAPLPRPVTAPAPLTRRKPGATLVGQPEFVRSGPVVASGVADPDEARQLVEQFEAGVFRALDEVRSQTQPEEGSR